MVVFIGFIMFMVITMLTDKDFDHDLVTEAYYERDLKYQTEIDAENNANSLSQAIIGAKTEAGWLVNFPQEIDAKKIIGTVFLYRPSNKRLDFNIPIVLSNSQLLIPDERLLDGRWNITIDWQYEGQHYLYKKSILY